MIDLHSHLLPGIDDGPDDDDGAIALAKAAIEAGIDCMAATPHIDQKHAVKIEELAGRRDRLQGALSELGIPLRILQGGELTGTRLLELDAEHLETLTLGAGPYLLLECPFTPAGMMFDNVVSRAQSLGFQVVLAHPERSPEFMGKPERLSELTERGALAQVTTNSLTGGFGSTVQRATIEFFAAGLVHVVASDAHDARHRSPRLMEGFAAVETFLPGIQDAAEYWVRTAPGAIVAGTPVPAPPPLQVSRGRLAVRRLVRSAGRVGRSSKP